MTNKGKHATRASKKHVSKRKSSRPRPSTSRNVRAPLARSTVDRTPAPRFHQVQHSDGRIKVTHREWIAEVGTSPDTFRLQQYLLQPGSKGTFEWLSGIASHYETYRFNKLVIDYEPCVSATYAGSIAIAVDYDAADQAPSTKQQMLSYQGAIKGPIWTGLSHVCPKVNLQKFKQRYVRNGKQDTTDGDHKVSDTGLLYVATSNAPGSTMVGDIYISYEVELFTPQVEYEFEGAKVASAGITNKARYLGATPLVLESDGEAVIQPRYIGVMNETGKNQAIVFKEAGDYLIDMDVNGPGVDIMGYMGTWDIPGILKTIGDVTASSSFRSFRNLLTLTSRDVPFYLDRTDPFSFFTGLDSSVTRISNYYTALQ